VARRALARAQEQSGDLAGAEATLAELRKRNPVHPDGHVPLALFLVRHERADEAASVLLEAVARVETAREKLVEPLWDVLALAGSSEATAAHLRGLAEEHLGDGDFLRAVASKLESEGSKGHALALLRHMVEAAPDDAPSIWRLARILADSKFTRHEAVAHLRHLIELAPDVGVARVRLAWLLMDDDPQAALALVEPCLADQDVYVYGAAAGALERLGRADEAEKMLRKAIQSETSPVSSLVRMIYDHLREDRYAEAAKLARRLHALEVPEDEQATADDAWLTGMRLGGASVEIQDEVRAMCEDGVPPGLAFEVYYGFVSFDRELAARAAEQLAEAEDDEGEALEWRVRAAGLRARLGDPGPLEAIAGALDAEDDEHASAWAALARAYAVLERNPEAEEAAERAYELDPVSFDAFCAHVEALERANRIDDALAASREFAEARPYEHQGPERLGIILAKLGQVEEALAMSERAVDAAPYCHVAMDSRALALFAAGDLEGARTYAEASQAADPPAADSEGDSNAELLLAALRADRAALDRGLAKLERTEPGAYSAWKTRLRQVASRQLS
jgi:tetratricopeptide (TPR) repeat protein